VTTVALLLDCLGQRCPLPVIALARALPTVPVGAVVEVYADDPAAEVDLPAWCRLRGQSYEGAAPLPEVPGGLAHRVRRTTP